MPFALSFHFVLFKQCETRWSPRFSCNLHSYLLEHPHLGITKTLPQSGDGRLALTDLTEAEKEELRENLRKRMRSLSRCLSEFQNRRWRPDPGFYKGYILQDTYYVESKITPPWFRALFMEGSRTFELLPTFPTDLLNATTEYKELSKAEFKITVSFIDDNIGIHGGVFVSEKLLPKGMGISMCDVLPLKRPSNRVDMENVSQAPRREPVDRSTFNHWRCASATDYHSVNYVHLSNQSSPPAESKVIYSNQSGIILQPTNNTPSDWLTSYCYSAMPEIPIYKRRIVLNGKFEIKDNESYFEKIFRIVVILGEGGEIKGIYRRQMTSERSFLSWRIVFD